MAAVVLAAAPPQKVGEEYLDDEAAAVEVCWLFPACFPLGLEAPNAVWVLGLLSAVVG